jgi:hypothetical protein
MPLTDAERQQMLALQAKASESQSAPLVAQDAAGKQINLGDTLTLPVKVTGIHASRKDDGGHDLNLSLILPGGKEVHLLSLDSRWVESR